MCKLEPNLHRVRPHLTQRQDQRKTVSASLGSGRPSPGPHDTTVPSPSLSIMEETVAVAQDKDENTRENGGTCPAVQRSPAKCFATPWHVLMTIVCIGRAQPIGSNTCFAWITVYSLTACDQRGGDGSAPASRPSPLQSLSAMA